MQGYDTFNISLDKKDRGADIDFVSHAHTDHISAVKGSKSVLMSDQTASLIEKVYSIGMGSRRIALPKTVKLINAGHILGSKQLAIEDDEKGEKIIYSGDFQMGEPLAAEPIEIESADTLILDSTYPQFGLKFESKEETGQNLVRWVNEKLKEGIVIISAYAIGKSQEIIKLMNNAGIVPVISKKITKASEVYNRYGARLEFFSAFNGDGEYESALKENFVGITEKDVGELAIKLHAVYNKRIFTAVATGFSKLYKFDTDAQFAISDHADFYQRIEYIDSVAPKKIYTYGKEASLLTNTLRRAGYTSEVYNSKVVSAKILVELDTNELH
jgi:Cft2 family RNA processing exonuclease